MYKSLCQHDTQTYQDEEIHFDDDLDAVDEGNILIPMRTLSIQSNWIKIMASAKSPP
ncbi:hypothetical protein M501DRAFT_995348 [Patellaria atrata CBS 101060]|uniref:Uncharacterized protein n=1 Tax=Patellaria atrata CBS 101060 TaxID=1346257 RepID=A0A9P4S794_9PEZI|nr:hypothetical protein M501DRAFT_995348 [Patellaria atrata CBS 101060]